MNFVSFANPAYMDVTGDLIDIDVVFAEGLAPVRYTCGRTDPVSAGLYAAVVTKGGIAPYAPTLAMQAFAAMQAGLTVTLSGSMTLAATVFPVDPETCSKIGMVVTNIDSDGNFPGGATSFPLKDVSGAWHTFTVPQYKAVATAIAAYAAPLTLIIDGNPLNATALPANSVTLTV